jgi:hypothetical protein
VLLITSLIAGWLHAAGLATGVRAAAGTCWSLYMPNAAIALLIAFT